MRLPERRSGVTAPVVFDARYAQDRYHGIGRYSYHLIRELVELLPARRFIVLRDGTRQDSRFDWAPLEHRDTVEMVALPAPPFGIREQTAVPGAVVRAHATLYHSPYFALPWALPLRGIVTVHDCIFEHDSRYMPQRWARVYYRILMLASLARARAVLVPSQATAVDVQRFYRVPVPKIRVTPEAADASFRPVADTQRLAAVRRQYDLPAHFILAVGARRPHKNFARLVTAMGAVDNGALVFVGEADARFPDDVAPVAAGLGSRIRFLGKVPEADLAALYTLADGLACPSLIEGFGLPVLEAMASGTPVVASDIPALREVAGDAALLVPPTAVSQWTATLTRLLGTPELRTELRNAGLARAAGFSWRRTATSVLPVYARLGIR